MKKTLFLAFCLPLIVSGCGRENKPVEVQTAESNNLPVISDTTTMEQKPSLQYLQDEKFNFTTEAQEAVLYLKTGLTGGAGSTAVIDPTTGELKLWDGKGIFVRSEVASHAEQGVAQYGCIKGNPLIRMAGKIQLKEQTFTNDSVPGGSTQSYYEVEVLELQSMDIKAEPC